MHCGTTWGTKTEHFVTAGSVHIKFHYDFILFCAVHRNKASICDQLCMNLSLRLSVLDAVRMQCYK